VIDILGDQNLDELVAIGSLVITQRAYECESASIPFVGLGDLDNNTLKGLISLLSIEQES
jgi:hypothetical protein